MNNYANGYQQYKEQSVNTMTKGELLILLYDEAIKRLTKAEFALKVKDYGIFEQSVGRTQEIINYLMKTLDHQYAISRELLRMYDFFMFELGRLQAGRRQETIDELRPLIVELRDAFKEADHIQRQEDGK